MADKVHRLTVDFWPVESGCAGVPKHRFQWFGDSEAETDGQFTDKLETDEWFRGIVSSYVDHNEPKDGLIVMMKSKWVERKKVEKASCDD